MSLKFLDDEKFEFEVEDDKGAVVETKIGSCRKLSMKSQRRVNKWLSEKFKKKVEIMGNLLMQAEEPVLDDKKKAVKDDDGNPKLQTLWATLEREGRSEIYVEIIKSQNPDLAKEDLESLCFQDQDELVMRILGLDEVYDAYKKFQDANFLSDSQGATNETGNAQNAESSDSAKSETAGA